MTRGGALFISGSRARPRVEMRSLLLIVAVLATLAAAAKRNNRDWAHLTEADYARMEEELEEPEERAEREAQEEKMKAKFDKAKSGVPAGFDMEAFQNAKNDDERQNILKSLKQVKPKKEGQGLALGHVFVTVRNFEGCCGPDRKAVNKLATKWSSLLASTGMDAAFSIWKDDQVAFETKHEDHVREITKFAMMQPEAALVRHDLEDEYGPAADAEWIAAHEQAIKDREDAKAAKIAANKKAAEKRKKKEEKAAKKKERAAAKKAAAAAAAGEDGEGSAADKGEL